MWSSGWDELGKTPGHLVRRVRNRRVCAKCDKPVHWGEGAVDHIIPRAEGGTHDLENLQLLCDDCHSVKTRAEHRRGQQRRAARGKFERETAPPLGATPKR